MFCEFVSDEPYANSFVSDIVEHMGHNYVCGYCIGHKSVVERMNENIIHKLFCRVSSGNNEVINEN